MINIEPPQDHQKNATIFLCFALVLPLLLLAQNIHALDSKRELNQYRYRYLTKEDGLPVKSAMDVIQTSDGYIWVGTQAGLARYNGDGFHVFGKDNTDGMIPEDYVYRLATTANGTLWIGTTSGLAYYADGIFAKAGGDIPPGCHVTAFETDTSGKLWVGTKSQGIFVGNETGFVPFKNNEEVAGRSVGAIERDWQGTIWIGAASDILRYSAGVFEQVRSSKQGVTDAISVIYEDPYDKKLIVGSTGGLCVLKDGRCNSWGGVSQMGIGTASDLYRDKGGNLWLASSASGLYRYQAGQFSNEGLPSVIKAVETISEDKESGLWLATVGAGVTQMTDGKLASYIPFKESSQPVVWEVVQDAENTLWISGLQGVLEISEDGKERLWNVEDGLTSNSSYAVVRAKDGGVWIGTQGGGASHIYDGTITHLHLEPGWPKFDIRGLFEARDGTLWFGTLDQGLLAWKDGAVVKRLGIEEGLPGSRVSGIIEAKGGGFWLATNKGIVKYKEGIFIRPRGEAGKLPVFTLSPYQDREGLIWYGVLNRGVGVIDSKGTAHLIDQSRGLPVKTVYAVLEDDMGYLWMSSDQGIVRISRAQVLEALASDSELKFELFDTSDGLISEEGTGGAQNHAWKLKDGKLAFGSMAGVSLVDPKHLEGNTYVPPVYIEKTAVDGLKIDAGAKIEAGDHLLEVWFAGLSFKVPDKVRFKYKLEGYDEDWSEETYDSYVRYTNLPSGEFVFKVLACNNDEVWNNEGAQVPFEIEKHFYETAWFVVLCLLALVGTIAVAVKVSIRRTERMNAELSRRTWEKTRGVLDTQVGVLREMTSNAAEVSGQLQELMGNLASSSDQVLAAVTETASTIKELETTGTSGEVNAQKIVDESEMARKVSVQGQGAVEKAVGTMRSLQTESQAIAEQSEELLSGVDQIGKIVIMAKAIADRSKILAINASIEAAQAGEKGEGFSVVANKMKELSIQSRESALEVAGQLNGFRKSIDVIVDYSEKGRAQSQDGAAIIAQSGEIVNLLTEKVSANSQLAHVISSGIVQQRSGLANIDNAIGQIAEAASRNAEMSHLITQDISKLDEVIEKLQTTTNKWQTPQFYE